MWEIIILCSVNDFEYDNIFYITDIKKKFLSLYLRLDLYFNKNTRVDE